jgi:hypothetical protein
LAKKIHKEMLSILGHNWNANQKHIKISPHYCCVNYHQEHKQQTLVSLWGKIYPNTLLAGNVN